MRAWILALVLLTVQPVAYAGDDADVIAELAAVELPDPPLEDPPQEALAVARTERLQNALRCPVCQGLSVAASPSDAARAMGNRIEELVREGYTEEQVTEYFVDRYGAWVELEPPSDEHPALFLAPLFLMGLGLVWLLIWARKRPREEEITPATTEQKPLPTPDPELAAWRERIIAELEGGPS
jgi:cytochrome c-type biogenesis protein CcmH